MELSRLPDAVSESGTTVQQFMSRQPAWVVGNELPWESIGLGEKKLTKGAYGGVVYTQAPLAASRVVEQEDKESENADENSRRGIHVSYSAYI